MYKLINLIVLLVLCAPPLAEASAEDLKHAQEELIRKTAAYGDELVKLLSIEEAAREAVERGLPKRRELYAGGLISRQELEQSEARLHEADARLRELRRQITESADLVAEVRLALETPSTEGQDATVIRFEGQAPWKPDALSTIESFYVRRFGEDLPVSAVGQTALHNRFGLLHTTAVDIALHPDSPQGLALLEFLRKSGTPFIAFRTSVPGSATGAHIHIGPPSQRIHMAL